MDEYEYEFFETSLIPILVGKVLSDVSREEEYLKGIGASEIEADDYYSYIMEGLMAVCDFWCGQEVGPYMDSCWFFSDRSMMEFYRLCRDWSRQRGIPLRRGNDQQLAQGICLRNVRLNQQQGKNNEVVNLLESYEIAA